MKKSVFKQWWFWVAVIVFIGIIANLDNGEDSNGNNNVPAQVSVNINTTSKPSPTPTPEPTPTLTPEEEEKKKHNKWVEAQFSLWDGSHTALVKLVKENMNDPKSFSHVETKYLILSTQEHIDTIGRGNIGDLFIYMKFRGKNAFGATMLSEVEAVADYQLNTITILNDF